MVRPPEAQQLDTTLDFWASFRDPKVEAAFRQFHEPEEKRLATFAAVLSAVAAMGFIPTDLAIMQATPRFYAFLAARIGVVLFSILAATVIHKGVTPVQRDLVAFVWLTGAMSVSIAVGYTRPSLYFLGYIQTTLVLVLVLFFVAPCPYRVQIGMTTFAAVAHGSLIISRLPELHSLLRRSTLVSYVVAWGIGAVVSWNLNRLKRQQFAALRKETELRTGLEQALAEVHKLRGFLPICAHCKSVRNDEGYWQQVEVYLREQTDAEVTHGICPNCMREHFGVVATPRSATTPS